MAKAKKAVSTAKSAAKKVAGGAFGKIFKRSFLMILLVVLGGVLFNLDRWGNTGMKLLRYKEYLPGFVVKMLPGGCAGNGTASSGQVIEGLVIEIYDGDTLTLLAEENGVEKKYKVRFYGIDAPEAAQAYGIEARDALRGKIFGEKVRVTVMSVDRYGRSVGKVMMGSRYINLEMVAGGNAWYYRDYAAAERELDEAEKDARNRRLGLWKSNSPQEPWLYRQENK